MPAVEVEWREGGVVGASEGAKVSRRGRAKGGPSWGLERAGRGGMGGAQRLPLA